MTLEQAVRRLTFDWASALGLYDRGLLRPGMAADIVIFDPDTVRPLPESVVHDFPAGGWRVKEPAAGIMATIVNGEVLMENRKHTGALPGRVLRNTTSTPTTPDRCNVFRETARYICSGRFVLRLTQTPATRRRLKSFGLGQLLPSLRACLKTLRREYRQQLTAFESDIDRSALSVGTGLRAPQETFTTGPKTGRWGGKW